MTRIANVATPADIARYTGRKPKPGARTKPERSRYRSRLEEEYADHLGLKCRQRELDEWRYEFITLRLAPRTSYTPDFVIRAGHYVEFMEVKPRNRKTGRFYATEKSWVKIKVAASLCPWPIWVVWPDGAGGWEYERVPRS